jgi:hypothetical protein
MASRIKASLLGEGPEFTGIPDELYSEIITGTDDTLESKHLGRPCAINARGN